MCSVRHDVVCCRIFEHTTLTSSAVNSENYRPRSRHLGGWFGWKGVYNILVKDAFNVSIVQEPETSFQDDVTAVTRRTEPTWMRTPSELIATWPKSQAPVYAFTR
jgi:hypothetical protein